MSARRTCRQCRACDCGTPSPLRCLDQHERDRHPDDVAAPDDDRVRAFQYDAGFRSSTMQPVGVAGVKMRLTAFHRQQADVDRVEAVHVLFEADAGSTCSSSICGGSGSCTSMPCTCRIVVERGDGRFGLRLGAVAGRMCADRRDPRLSRRLGASCARTAPTPDRRRPARRPTPADSRKRPELCRIRRDFAAQPLRQLRCRQ